MPEPTPAAAGGVRAVGTVGFVYAVQELTMLWVLHVFPALSDRASVLIEVVLVGVYAMFFGTLSKYLRNRGVPMVPF